MALPKAIHNDMLREFSGQVELLGTTFTHTPKSGGSNTVKASFVDPSNEDVNLINSFGLEARVLRMAATPAVNKYETLTDPNGRRYSIQAVHDVWVNDTKVGQTLYVVSK